jgi:glycosyltransferase involved in cell wall biosynthesis
MHIVHVTHRAWPVAGGSERYVQEVARRQVLDGHRVTILATDADALSALWDRRGRRIGAEVPDEYQGVRIRRLRVRYLPLGSLAFAALRRFTWLVSHISVRAALLLGWFSPWLPGLGRALDEEPADLLFAWNITLEGLTAAVACQAQRQGVPWIAVPLLHLGRPRFYTMRHQLDLLQQAARVVVQTASERAFLLEHGFSLERAYVISPGVDPDEACQANGDRFRHRHRIEGPLVVTLGALGYDKGTVHLLAAAQQLWEEKRPLTIALIGTMEKAVQRAMARLPVTARCLCLGQVSEDEKWDVLDAADIVALPSRTESFGIVFLEAWLRGKPVIGAQSGATCDVIEDGVDGLLVTFGDVASLTNVLRTLLDDPGQAAEMGRRGKEKALREYTWERQYGRLRVLTDQLMRELT